MHQVFQVLHQLALNPPLQARSPPSALSRLCPQPPEEAGNTSGSRYVLWKPLKS
ncbi:MAG: hypothetical protein RLZZ117_984 [Cyanobacteriota bacterium]|jgi:hypothetical protein